MKPQFKEELACLAEIEEIIENTNLLQHEEIRSHFELLLELRDELLESTTDMSEMTESILEDISLVTGELTSLVENRLLGIRDKQVRVGVGSKRIN